MSDFETWWKGYPLKVGKFAAEREFQKARKKASLEELIAGVERYIGNKPLDVAFCHPRTWLHQGRWLDEYGQRGQQDRRQSRECTHTPRCPNPGNWQCQQRTVLDAARRAS